jgi:hypothetical protein
MRLFSIRRAKNLDPELQKTFERYGQVGMQIAFKSIGSPVRFAAQIGHESEPIFAKA